LTIASPVRAVLFDAGNTLVYLDRDRLIELLAVVGVESSQDRVRTAELAARAKLHEGINEGQVGTEPELWHEYFVALFRGCGVPDDRVSDVGLLLRDKHHEDHMWTGVEPGTMEALDRLATAGIRLGVISNADGRMAAVIERCGLMPYFEFVVDSETVGVEKPDPAIFHGACRRLDLDPGDCLYVGDLYPVDYLGATNAGLQGLLLDPLGLHEGRAPCVSTLPDLATLLEAL
jgi:HAD superfamily hydrolase (TIGR01549 family)